MTRTVKTALFAFAALLLSACTSHPLMNVYDRAVPNSYSGEPHTNATVAKAIMTGCIDKGWTCREVGPGQIEASISVRKHRATAEIDYNAQRYSIVYKESYLLDYNSSRSTIHRNYNRWINNLDHAIAKNLVL